MDSVRPRRFRRPRRFGGVRFFLRIRVGGRRVFMNHVAHVTDRGAGAFGVFRRSYSYNPLFRGNNLRKYARKRNGKTFGDT